MLPIAGQVPVNSPMFQALAHRQAGNPLMALLMQQQNRSQTDGQLLQAQGQMSPAQPDSMASPVNAPVMTPAPSSPAAPESPEQMGIWSRLGQGVQNFAGDPDRMARLTLALNSMRLTPDAGIAHAANNQLAQSQAQRRNKAREQRAAEYQQNQANQTAEYFRNNGREDLANFIEANPGNAGDIVRSFASSQQGGGEAFMPMTGAQLRQMGMEGIGDGLYNYNARTGEIKATGSGGTTVNIGEKQNPGFVEFSKLTAQRVADWQNGERADTYARLAQTQRVLGMLNRGEAVTGAVYGNLPDWARAMYDGKTTEAQDLVEEVVQRNLRAVLGAQFAQKEGERLIARAFNPRLTPEQNIVRVSKLFETMELAANERDRQSSHFMENRGDMSGYQFDQSYSIQTFIDAMDTVDLPAGEMLSNPNRQQYDGLPMGAQYLWNGEVHVKGP